MSTSTVARKVTAIEEALGVALLHRSTHSVTLTEAGHIYLERAVTLIADLDDTLRVVAELNAQPSGPLKLTAPVAFGRRHLAPLVAPFLARYPTIQLDVRLTDNHNDLVAGGFDLDIHEGENWTTSSSTACRATTASCARRPAISTAAGARSRPTTSSNTTACATCIRKAIHAGIS